MAHAQWDTDNLRFRGTQSVSATGSYVVLNNTKTILDVDLAHSSSAVDTVELKMGPGEVFAYAPGTAGTITFTGTASHTAVNVSNPVEWVDDRGAAHPMGSASLVYTPF